MNKTLLASAASLAGAAALVGGMTFASFNDTQTSQFPSLVSAGTLQLNQQGVTSPLEVKNMKPGDTADFTISLRNSGSLAGNLYAKVNEIKGYEDGCDVVPAINLDDLTEAQVERAVDANCGDLRSGGDLTKYLTYYIVDSQGNEQQIKADGSNEADLGAIASKAIDNAILRVKFGKDPLTDKYSIAQQNDAQGDAATIQLKFALVQS